MPMHDWKKVDAGIYHAFHHRWISAISDHLNAGTLPADYYALPEQIAAGLGPDVLTLQTGERNGDSGGGTVTQPRPATRFVSETANEYYRRKKSSVVVRHVSGDRMVAVLEIVSPGNKASRDAFRAFVSKVCELLELHVHLLLVDPFPPTNRDPTLVAYETGLVTRAYIEPFAVDDPLPRMPLYLEPALYVLVPLEETYQTAFSAMPQRWRRVLDSDAQ